eukprot:TRINITY_DN9251_c0_g1_i1.p1 TRINITY_DN9251_c0_g1~~TRINITY_DN9251_c0_g1_i1.p1  ORF type:complete len:852 (+),score=136.98 TRINITY_DN9251_c0_g1_i1:56-2557(+)
MQAGRSEWGANDYGGGRSRSRDFSRGRPRGQNSCQRDSRDRGGRGAARGGGMRHSHGDPSMRRHRDSRSPPCDVARGQHTRMRRQDSRDGYDYGRNAGRDDGYDDRSRDGYDYRQDRQGSVHDQRDSGRSGGRDPGPRYHSRDDGRSPDRAHGYGRQSWRDSNDRPRSRSRSAHRQEETTKILEFPRVVMGRIIGKQGATINDIRSRSGADIKCDEVDGGSKCEFKIRGSPREVKMAKQLILDVAGKEEKGSSNQGKKVEKKMQIPPSMVGRVIGRAGETINALQDRSGAHIDVGTKDLAGDVILTGSEEAVAKAKELILDLVDRAEMEARSDNGSSRGATAKVEETMTVPLAMVGRIIGKGGKTVMQLQDDSRAKIDIVKEEGKINLQGSREDVAYAKRLITEILDRAAEEEGAQESSNHPVQLQDSMDVPMLMVGRIMGKGGQTIMQMQQDSGAKIQISRGENMVRFLGSSEAIAHAKQMVADVMRQAEMDGVSSGGSVQPQKVDDYMQVQPSMIGRIIGKGGETITKLQQNSGAKIKIIKTENTVHISGSREMVEDAKRLISDIINQEDDSAQQAPKFEESVAVPGKMAGRIIGKGGEKIKQLQRQSGAKIDMTRDQPGVVRLSGSVDAIVLAKLLIDEVIEGGDAVDGEASIEKTMQIPSDMVEKVVGEGGEGVKKIEGESGAEVAVDTKDKSFKLHLSGPSNSVKKAQSLILDRIVSERTLPASSPAAQGFAGDTPLPFPPPPPPMPHPELGMPGMPGMQTFHAEHVAEGAQDFRPAQDHAAFPHAWDHGGQSHVNTWAPEFTGSWTPANCHNFAAAASVDEIDMDEL